MDLALLGGAERCCRDCHARKRFLHSLRRAERTAGGACRASASACRMEAGILELVARSCAAVV
eukprot:5896583-Alexandrium_andersonii.AAC.1